MVNPPPAIDQSYEQFYAKRAGLRVYPTEFVVRTFLANYPGLKFRKPVAGDRVLDIATELQCLNGGWSADPACKLSWSQKQWLDADALEAAQAAHETQTAAIGAVDGVLAAPESTEWRDKVAEDFARWLNATLSTDKIRMGDAEFSEWKHTFLEVLP